MKKLGIIFIIILSISPETPNNDIYALEDMAMIVKENNLTTEEWVVTVKEKVSKEHIRKQLIAFQKKYSVKRKKDENVEKYFIENIYKDDEIIVSFELTIPQEKERSPELVATIKGTNLQKTTLTEYKKILKYICNQFFTKKFNLFTCLTTTKNDMIQSDDFSNKVSKYLDLKYMSTQSDIINEVSYEEIIYGYTALWNNEILIKDKPLNIQIVIQSLKNEKQKVIIGTPLLITEY